MIVLCFVAAVVVFGDTKNTNKAKAILGISGRIF
jgi:hypothetical protein